MSERFFAHPLALVDSEEIGPDTRVWAWSHVMKGAKIGSDCNIGEHCFIEQGAVLGDRVTVKNGVSIWEGVTCEDGVFVGPHAVLTNDIRPRSKVYGVPIVPTLLSEGATVGANATLLCGITVGRHAMIGAGAVVTKDVEDHGLVFGNPARRHGHVCICSRTLAFAGERSRCSCGRSYRKRTDAVELVET